LATLSAGLLPAHVSSARLAVAYLLALALPRSHSDRSLLLLWLLLGSIFRAVFLALGSLLLLTVQGVHPSPKETAFLEGLAGRLRFGVQDNFRFFAWLSMYSSNELILVDVDELSYVFT
jgi:hypothetical protein